MRKSKICKICVRDKQRKRLLNTRKRNLYQHSIKFFDLIHSDICKMFENYNRFQYFIIFMNDYTCTIFVKCLQIKNEIFQAFKNFYVFIWTQFDVTIWRIRSDNEDEYVTECSTGSSRFSLELKANTEFSMNWQASIISKVTLSTK